MLSVWPGRLCGRLAARHRVGVGFHLLGGWRGVPELVHPCELCQGWSGAKSVQSDIWGLYLAAATGLLIVIAGIAGFIWCVTVSLIL